VSGTDHDRRKQYETLRWLDDNLDHYFVPFPDRLNWRRSLRYLNALQDLDHVIREFAPDLIHMHSLSLAPYLFFLRHIHKTPFVSTAHSNPDLERRDIKLGAAVNRWLSGFLGDEMIAISTDLARSFIEDLNIAPRRVHVIHHGIDTDYFRPPTHEERIESRKMFGSGPNEHIVCLVGQLEPVKGHRVLFDAIKILTQLHLNVRVLCAGEGTLEQDLRGYADSIGISDRIQFVGFVDSRTVYWASDTKVLPSYREGFALVVPEAMLCGLPVIRTPAAGAKDQIDVGATGFIIPFDSPSELADRIHYLARNPAKRESMGKKARATAMKRFSLNESISRLQSVYLSVRNL